jgi:hypothetical protein
MDRPNRNLVTRADGQLRQFTASAWRPRPDGQPVDDHRPRSATTRTVPAPSTFPFEFGERDDVF